MRAGFGGGEYPFRDRLIVCVYGPARPAAGHPVRLACVAAQDQACLALALLRKASESCRESAFPGPTTAAGVCWALPVVGTAAAVSVAYAVIRPAAPSTWWPAPGGRFDRQRPELLRLLVATRRRPGRARRVRWPRAGRWQPCSVVDLMGQRPMAGSSVRRPSCCAWCCASVVATRRRPCGGCPARWPVPVAGQPAAPSTWWAAPGRSIERQRPELLRLVLRLAMATRRRPCEAATLAPCGPLASLQRRRPGGPAPGRSIERQRPELLRLVLRLLVATRRRPGRARRARWPRAGRWRACIAVDLVGQRPAAGSSASGPRCCAWWWPRAAGLAVRGRHAGPLRAAGGHAAPLMPVETRAVRSSLPVRSQRTAPRLADPELSICCPRTAARCTLQAGQPMAGAVGGRLLYGA